MHGSVVLALNLLQIGQHRRFCISGAVKPHGHHFHVFPDELSIINLDSGGIHAYGVLKHSKNVVLRSCHDVDLVPTMDNDAPLTDVGMPNLANL